MQFNEKNKLDVIPILKGDLRLDPYQVNSQTDVVVEENLIETKIFNNLKIGNNIKPDDSLEGDFSGLSSRELALLELRRGIPIGGLKPVFEKGKTPFIDVKLDNDRIFTMPIPKKNFFMKNSSSSLGFPPDVENSFSQKSDSIVENGIDSYYKKMEIFLEDFGPYYESVSRENSFEDPFKEIFINKTLTDESDSIMIFDFFKRGK